MAGLPPLTQVFGVDSEEPGSDVFVPARRAAVDALKPDRVEDDEVVMALSKAFGAVERGANEARYVIERIPDIDHELAFEHMDQLCDHAYESWRRLVYGEPMVRWVRTSKLVPDMTEVFDVNESTDDDEWERSLGQLPGQKVAQQKADAQARKDATTQARRDLIARRSQASAGGTTPLSRAPVRAGTDPGARVKDLLGRQPMNRMELLRGLHQTDPMGGDRPFDWRKTLGQVNRHPGFKFDDYLGKVATQGPDERWRLK